VTLVSVDPEQGFIDFAHDPEGTSRKLERSRRKKRAALTLSSRLGQTFDAVVTGVTPTGTWVRLTGVDIAGAEGKVVRGARGLTPGERVRVTLVGTDPVHGFIDFERVSPHEERKRERRRRKQHAAAALVERVGERFDAEVTGVTPKATWIRLLAPAPEVEGRLVRGRRGLSVGDRLGVVLLDADPQRGWIDFAREDRP
jgi:exoribonuclease R